MRDYKDFLIGFSFCGTDNDAYRQIGNAVAVPMGRWIGEQIVRYFEQ